VGEALGFSDGACDLGLDRAEKEYQLPFLGHYDPVGGIWQMAQIRES
jgi:hypothetical protein